MTATMPHQPEHQRRQNLPCAKNIEADKRFFELRESGWTGWINQDDYKAVDLDQWESDHEPQESKSMFPWRGPSYEERRQGWIFHLAMSEMQDAPADLADLLEEYDLTEELIDYVRERVTPYMRNAR